MTLSDDDFRDFAALAAMINLAKQIDWQDAIDPTLAKHVASQCFNLADAMLEESQRRRSAGTSNHPESSDSCDGLADPHKWSIYTMRLRPSAAQQMEKMGIRTIGDLIKHTAEDLLSQNRIGEGTIWQIGRELSRFNLSLKDK